MSSDLLARDPAGEPVVDHVAAAWSVIADYAESTVSLNTLCRQHGTTAAWFFRCALGDSQIAENWTIAKRIRAQTMADAALDASQPTDEDWLIDSFGRYSGNTGKLKRDALRAQTLLTLAGHHDPENFGNRVIHDGNASSVILQIGDPSVAAAAHAQRLKDKTK